MSVEKLKRVLWRLRRRHPDRERYTIYELKKCIMLEIGTSPACYKQNRKALVDLGWIKTYRKHQLSLTDKDLTET